MINTSVRRRTCISSHNILVEGVLVEVAIDVKDRGLKVDVLSMVVEEKNYRNKYDGLSSIGISINGVMGVVEILQVIL